MTKKLEALEVLQNYIMVNEPLETQKPYLQRLNAIRKALTPPTSDEVCEAIRKNPYYTKYKIFCDSDALTYISCGDPDVICNYTEGRLVIYSEVLTPAEINLISRFYMGVDSK